MRKQQTPRRGAAVKETAPAEPQGPKFVSIQLGQETYLYGGKPHTGLVKVQTHDNDGEEIPEGVKKAESLRRAVERWERSEDERLAAFKKAGVASPTTPPVHATLQESLVAEDEDEETEDEGDDGDENEE